MKASKLLLSVPFVAALAMVPQGQDRAANADNAMIVGLSELQYTVSGGESRSIASRDLVEIRVLTDLTPGIRLELVYDNGDYSMIDAQQFHLLRGKGNTREVKIVRSRADEMRYPRLP